MRKPVTTYPCQWVNIDFGVKQLVIIIILQIPLLHNTIYIWSITNKSCNITYTSVISIKSTTRPMLFTRQGLHSDCLVPAKEKYEIHTAWLQTQFSSCDLYQFCS